MYLQGVQRSPSEPCMLPDLRVALHANLLECGQGEVRRIPLPRRSMNKVRASGRAGAPNSPGSITHIAPELSLCLAYDVALYTTTSPAVTWGGFGSKGARCSPTNSPALKLDCSSASLCSKTLIPTITPSPASSV